MIIPILLYGCEIWGPYLIGRLTTFEIFKSKFFKIINEIERIHLRSKTTNLTIYAELGKVPLIVQISTLVVKYLIRISSTYFNNTLSGEARNVCMRLNLKPIVLIQFLLKR